MNFEHEFLIVQEHLVCILEVQTIEESFQDEGLAAAGITPQINTLYIIQPSVVRIDFFV